MFEKSVFIAKISTKNRLLVVIEMKSATDNWLEEKSVEYWKNRQYINKISAKNMVGARRVMHAWAKACLKNSSKNR